MPEKKYVVAVTGISGENGQHYEEGQPVTQKELGATFARHQRLGSLREATKEDETAWKRKQIERGQMPADAASEVTTGNETSTGVGRKGKVDGEDQGEDLEALTVPVLRERAEALGITPMPTLKADLIKAIQEADAANGGQ